MSNGNISPEHFSNTRTDIQQLAKSYSMTLPSRKRDKFCDKTKISHLEYSHKNYLKGKIAQHTTRILNLNFYLHQGIEY